MAFCAVNQISGNESSHGNCWFHQRCQPACNDCVIRTRLNLYLTPVPTHIQTQLHAQLHERVTTVLTSAGSREEQPLKILKQIQRKAVSLSLLWMVVNPQRPSGRQHDNICTYDAAFCPIKVHSHNTINPAQCIWNIIIFILFVKSPIFSLLQMQDLCTVMCSFITKNIIIIF